MTLKQFSQNIKNLRKQEIEEINELILREMTFRFLREVIRLTPVGQSKYINRRLRAENGGYLRYNRGKRKGRIKTKRTNVYTGGALRRGWIIKKKMLQKRIVVNNKAKPTDKEIANFVKSLKFKKRGRFYSIQVVNPVEYAKFINYGHRTRGGKGWVQGYHFLEQAEKYINRNQDKIFNHLYERELKRRLGL